MLVIGLLSAALLGTLVPRTDGSYSGTNPIPSRHILLLSNAIHTDIALPIDDDLLAKFAFLRDGGLPIDTDGALYLVFGWGGRSFYIETPNWSDLKFMPVARSFTMDSAALHIAVTGEISPSDPQVQAFNLSEDRLQRLIAFIKASFAQQGDGGPILIPGASYGAYDVFYEANGKFNALVGCNTWTARALREAGLTTGWWNPLPVSLRASLRLHNQPLPLLQP